MYILSICLNSVSLPIPPDHFVHAAPVPTRASPAIRCDGPTHPHAAPEVLYPRALARVLTHSLTLSLSHSLTLSLSHSLTLSLSYSSPTTVVLHGYRHPSNIFEDDHYQPVDRGEPHGETEEKQRVSTLECVLCRAGLHIECFVLRRKERSIHELH